MFTHTQAQLQDVTALIVSSVMNRQCLENSRNYASGYELMAISSYNIRMGGLLLLNTLSQIKLKGRDEGTNK
jgi:hypothetical protein